VDQLQVLGEVCTSRSPPILAECFSIDSSRADGRAASADHALAGSVRARIASPLRPHIEQVFDVNLHAKTRPRANGEAQFHGCRLRA